MRKISLLTLAGFLLALSCTKTGVPDIPGQIEDNNNGESSETPTEVTPEDSNVDVDDDDDNIANTSFDATITITFNGSSATVDGTADGVTVTTDGARVVADNTPGTSKVKYVLTGTSTDGCFKLYSTKKQAIVLSSLNLTNTTGAAINNQSKKRTFVVLDGESTLQDCSVNSSGDYPEQTSDEDMKAAFFSEAQLIFSGDGSLNVNALGKSGITSDDYVKVMEGPTINVNSKAGHGIKGKDAVIISGGTVNVTVESGATGKKCFNTDSLVCITGGTTTLVNNASAGTVDGDLTGADCIKSDDRFVIQGGVLNATATGKGCKCISTDGNAYFEGGKVVAKSSGANYGTSNNNRWGGGDDSNSTSAKTIKVDGNIDFTGADVWASCANHEAIESKGTICITAGTIYASSKDDAINCSNNMTINGGVLYAFSSGNDGLDANGNLIMNGGTVFAVGCGSPEVAVDANTESGYRFYLKGGDLIAIGGIESNSSVSEYCAYTQSWSKNTNYTLCDGDDVLFSFKSPASGGSGLYMFSSSLKSGSSYTLKTGATVSDATTYFDGILSIGGTSTGGSSSTLTATSYSGGGGMGGGGGNNPGGGHGPGGW